MTIYSKKGTKSHIGEKLSICIKVKSGGISMLVYLLFVLYSSVDIMLGCRLYFQKTFDGSQRGAWHCSYLDHPDQSSLFACQEGIC
jgi:hypothetical protein